MSGLFITMEGCEGAGKSLQCRKLERHLKESGYKTLLTREPGGAEISEQIRKIILNPGNASLSPAAEALLYSAARAQHVAEVIGPALKNNCIVICDRFTDSSVAYQGYARGLGPDVIDGINAFASGGITPDITFFIDLNPGESFSRKRKNAALDRIELEDAEFHYRVYEGYKQIAQKNPQRVAVINGRRGPQEIHAEIIEKIRPLLININKTDTLTTVPSKR